MRVHKAERLDRREGDRRTRGGLAEKRFRNPKRRKEKAKQRKHPTTYAPDS